MLRIKETGNRSLGRLQTAKVLLTAVFVLSFVQYFVPLTIATQIVPVVLMVSVAFFLFLKMARKGTLGGLVPVAPMLAAAVLPLIASLVLARQDSALYGALMIAVLLAARTFVATIGLDAVISCYFQASIINVILLVAASAGELAEFRFGGGRFAPLAFHPNLLALSWRVTSPFSGGHRYKAGVPGTLRELLR